MPSPAQPSAERRPHLDSSGVVLIVGCCLVWGLGQVASKVALGQVPPLTQAGTRSLGAALLVLTWAAWRHVPMGRRDRTWWPGLLAGVLFAGEFAAVYSGLSFTTASRMTVFLYLAPFVVAAGMTIVSHDERLGRLGVIGLVTAFAGVAVAFSEGFTSASAPPHQWLGDLLGILAAVLWGATTLVVRATPLGAAPAAKTLLYQLAVSGVVLTAAGLALEPRVAWPLDAAVAVSMVFQILVISSTSYLLWFWLITRYAAARLSAFTLLTPVVGLLAGAVLLHEPLTLRLLVALTTVCLGLVLVNRR
ncbi:MAG: DMT family transporter [Dermatophilaceae bacterium]